MALGIGGGGLEVGDGGEGGKLVCRLGDFFGKAFDRAAELSVEADRLCVCVLGDRGDSRRVLRRGGSRCATLDDLLCPLGRRLGEAGREGSGGCSGMLSAIKVSVSLEPMIFASTACEWSGRKGVFECAPRPASSKLTADDIDPVRGRGCPCVLFGNELLL